MFKSIIPINTYSKKDIQNWKKTNVVSLYVKINNNVASFECLHNEMERTNSIIKIIEATLKNYQINDVEILINVSDLPINNPYFLQFSRTTNAIINTIPNFSFYQWDEAKIKVFFEVQKDILDTNVDWDNKIDKIMWSGINSHPIRKRFNELQSNPMYEYNLLSVGYNRETSKYYDLIDHSKYKYLLDLEGRGYSGRFPYLALTGSCVIFIENSDPNRDYKLYYDEHFQENIHYLKVRYSEKDTVEEINSRILQKISKSDCKKIGEACKNVAIDLFTFENIQSYMADILNYYSTFYVDSDEPINQDNYQHNMAYLTDRLKKKLCFNKFK